ncbi:uncharacterized protein LOC123224886 [Mangifera indica]|uniref:uncharacterized protein LOC123224886 n=1 Tax=Mangifera indica TaxID=29780 RepID=UPI001CFA796A|nr:uncharacterized protein LOC123224886 [Mangifera indica]
MLGAKPKEPKEAGGEASALEVRSTPEVRKGGWPWCDHCRKPDHIKDKCWKIYGKPTDWKPAKERDSKANLSSFSVAEPFSKEQLELLQKLIAQEQPSQMVIGSRTVAQKGFALGEDD